MRRKKIVVNGLDIKGDITGDGHQFAHTINNNVGGPAPTASSATSQTLNRTANGHQFAHTINNDASVATPSVSSAPHAPVTFLFNSHPKGGNGYGHAPNRQPETVNGVNIMGGITGDNHKFLGTHVVIITEKGKIKTVTYPKDKPGN